MKRMKILLALMLTGIMTGSMIVPTFGYFTANTQSSGQLEIQPLDTTIHEPAYSDGVKLINIRNSADGTPVYVRARGFAGTTPDGGPSLTYSSDDNSWIGADDGWWYYTPVLNGGETTSDLKVSYSLAFPDKDSKIDNFNVIVVYEAVPPAGADSAQAAFQAFINQEGGN